MGSNLRSFYGRNCNKKISGFERVGAKEQIGRDTGRGQEALKVGWIGSREKRDWEQYGINGRSCRKREQGAKEHGVR